MTTACDVGCWCPDVGWADELDPAGWTRTQRTWTLDGAVWRRRGEGALETVALRRLAGRGRVRVFHAAAGRVHEHIVDGREQLLDAAVRGRTDALTGSSELEGVELRDARENVAVLVLEAC